MDPNMFGTNQQWASALKFVLVVIALLIGGAFALGAWRHIPRNPVNPRREKP